MALAESMPRPTIIDLTEADAERPVAFSFPTSREGPPTKRRRVGDNGKHGSPKVRLQDQVLPHVARALNALPRQEFLVGDIGSEVLRILASTPDVRIRLDETRGSLLPTDHAKIAALATDTVRQLALLPTYQIRHLPPALPPIRITQSTNAHTKRFLRSPNGRDYRFYIQLSTGTSDMPPQRWFCLDNRPYRSTKDRDSIANGAYRLHKESLSQPLTYHVDFSTDEIDRVIQSLTPKFLPVTISFVPHNKAHKAALSSTFRLLGDQLPPFLAPVLPHRNLDDIRNFCADVAAGKTLPAYPRVLSVRQKPTPQHRNSRIHALVLARELDGNRGFGHNARRLVNFQAECIKAHEDRLRLVTEFTNCAGDIATISWVSKNSFICGTTTHSDAHNQQYNKQGNLLLFSAPSNTLQAFADHRIPRPIVETGDNSTTAMRLSQDPWLYSSVVSSDYDEALGVAYTSSFDKTVKVWKVDGGNMTSISTWHHEGNVNFIVAAKDGSGRAASAADIPSDAVRVYTINPRDLSASPFVSLSCTRTDANGSDKWAYFPSTMQWGRAPGTQHLLAIGYSPRSLSGDDHDIPEDKMHTGEIMLWDAQLGRRVPVLTATTANVFEIIWHPTLPRFIVATTPCGLTVEHGVRTQIHLFQRDVTRTDGAYHEFQNLDCAASDINELTIMPNSLRHAYITAACTDGCVYVWDTAQGDRPIHVLRHGKPLDEFFVDREKEDTGVKFTAWGSTPDRFYTGSSDGVVKVWNIRHKKNPFIRNLLEAPGPISYGAFLQDRSQLAVGDATGRVFIFSLYEADSQSLTTVPGSNRLVRRPRPYSPHAEPPPPEGQLASTVRIKTDAEEAFETYIGSGTLLLHPNPVIGAVKGPYYGTTGLYCREAHRDNNPLAPLLSHYERLQQESIHLGRGRRRSMKRLKAVGLPDSRLTDMHRANKTLDLDLEGVDEADLAELIKEGAELSIKEAYGDFTYEDSLWEL